MLFSQPFLLSKRPVLFFILNTATHLISPLINKRINKKIAIASNQLATWYAIKSMWKLKDKKHKIPVTILVNNAILE